jgi:oligosaccharyltransferase complex subunit alpha (ribophorin I)
MRALSLAAALCSFLAVHADSNLTSQTILPSTFKPPQVFKNVNLLRSINLEKAYARETINVVIENIDKAPQSEYYLPFAADTIGKVGGLEVADKKAPEKGQFNVEVVEYDPDRFVTRPFHSLSFPRSVLR